MCAHALAPLSRTCRRGLRLSGQRDLVANFVARALVPITMAQVFALAVVSSVHIHFVRHSVTFVEEINK